MSLHVQNRKSVIRLGTTEAGRGGTRNNIPGWWFDESSFSFFQWHKLRLGLGSASGRLSSPLMVRSSQGIEWNCTFFHESPLPSLWARAGLKVERIWRAQCGWATHLYTFTHGALVHALFHWGLREKERVRLKKKDARFCSAAGAHHGDGKMDHQVEDEKMAVGFNTDGCSHCRFNSSSCYRPSR